MQEVTVEQLIAQRDEALALAQETCETYRLALSRVVKQRDELRQRLAALMLSYQARSDVIAEWARLDKEAKGQS